MLAQPPTITSTYTIQTFGQTTSFAVPSDATDLYFEVYTNPQGIDTFEQITQAQFQQAQQSALLVAKGIGDAMRQEHSAPKASRRSLLEAGRQ
jgi:hypothetical protein